MCCNARSYERLKRGGAHYAASRLEALLKTERHQATRQFTTRVPALAGDLGLQLADFDWEESF